MVLRLRPGDSFDHGGCDDESAGDVMPPGWAALFDLIAEDAALFRLPIQAAIGGAGLAKEDRRP